MNMTIEAIAINLTEFPCETGEDYCTRDLQLLVDTGQAWQDEYTSKLAAAAIGSGMIGERKWN